MLAKKRGLIAISFSLIASITGGILFATVISSIYLLEGGFDAVVQGWKNNGAESSNWKWALASVPLCFWGGVFIWRWFMLRTGLLTKEEMDEAWGTNQNDRS